MNAPAWAGLRRSGVLPAFGMLAVVVALNAWLQPRFFGRASLEGDIATFAPTILVCLAQALFVLNRELDLSVGAGVSLINCVLATVPAAIVGGPWGAAAIGLAVALALGGVNGALVGYVGLPSLIATFATGAIWFGVALMLMPQPGGTVDAAIGDFYGGEAAGLPVPFLIVLGAMAGLALLAYHRLGRRILAVGSNPDAAFQAGIPVARVKLLTYLIGW
ncbi:MAG: hypothetical protein JOY65_06935, partial [Acetobacteraceae bacterium]|nr:hypothetical protein [Acetobacteraceae bacterium]